MHATTKWEIIKQLELLASTNKVSEIDDACVRTLWQRNAKADDRTFGHEYCMRHLARRSCMQLFKQLNRCRGRSPVRAGIGRKPSALLTVDPPILMITHQLTGLPSIVSSINYYASEQSGGIEWQCKPV